MTFALLAAETHVGWDLAVFGALLLGYALVSKRFHGTPVTPAIVMMGGGILLGSAGIGFISSEPSSGAIKALAETTLAMVLFTDAASIRPRQLAREKGLPVRLLLIGLPLTIVVGTVVGLPLFPGIGVFEILALAIVLAPTDAALGEPVVSDPRLPSELRQGLNVESGLNDGICVPLLFAALAMAELDAAPSFSGQVIWDLLSEVALASGVGIVVAASVALLFRTAKSRGFVEGRWRQVIPLMTALIAYTATVELGGSGFVATFAAGLVYRRVLGEADAEESVRLTEELGSLLSAATFFVFGAVVLDPALTGLNAATVVYAVLSLTVVRMLPVAVAMMNTGAKPPTVLFAGWFGPRGLASIVFTLIIVEDTALPGTSTIVRVVALTVVLSVIAHGASAAWLTSRYVGWLGHSTPEAVRP